MKIGRINNVQQTSTYKPFKAQNHTSLNSIGTSPSISKAPILLTLAAGLAAFAVIKGSKAVENIINSAKKRNTGYIIIPIERKNFELDAKKLRKLPLEIRSQAINALNAAITAEEKNEVIKRFGIAR
ncbi:hypothetical protein IJ182_07885 [bacterium]|nr:hypothetical protein [bacterium]